MGESSFWYRPTRVVPDQRPLNGRCCCLCLLTGPSRLVISQLESVSQDGFAPPTHTRSAALLSGTTQVSRYQKGRTNPDFTEARDSEWQWHQLGHMQVCTSLQTYNHASTSLLSFFQAGCPSCRPTNSVKALKALALSIRDIVIISCFCL